MEKTKICADCAKWSPSQNGEEVDQTLNGLINSAPAREIAVRLFDGRNPLVRRLASQGPRTCSRHVSCYGSHPCNVPDEFTPAADKPTPAPTV